MYTPISKSGPVVALFFCNILAALAVPVAVNDTYTTQEDVPAGSVAVEVLNAGFEGGGAPVSFTLPNAWQIIDLPTTAAGGTNTYPSDGAARNWKATAYDTATSTLPGWRAGTFPVRGGDISHPNFTAVPSTLTGLVPGGTNTVNTYLMRNVFTLSAAQAAHPAWEFTALVDDGAIIYVNGVEKARFNYPAGQPAEVDSTNGGTAGDEGAYSTIAVNLAGALVTGQNVISIELHQNSSTSSDVGLDFTMTPVASAATFGFAGVDDAFFGTANPAYSAQTHTATGGFNGGGGLSLQLGNVAAGAASQQVSGAWRRSFTLATAGTVNISFRHRLISGQDYDAGEYQELICDVNGTAYGTVTSPSTHPAVAFLTGNGNGGGPQDTGWAQSSFNIPLTAGTHTLSLGGFGSAGSAGFFGNAAEGFEGFFDDVVITASANVSLLANDTGGVPPVTAVKVANPAHGTVTVNPDGTFLYTPDTNYNGPDSFTYRAVDGTGQSAPATVTINITPVNDPPLAVADGPYNTSQDVPLTISAALGVLANDSDAEGSGLTAEVGVAPVSGTLSLSANGGFTYTPAAGFAGTDTFTYRANDGTATSAFAAVTINVINIPDAPVAVADAYTAVKNTALTVTALTGGTTSQELLPYKSPDWHYYDSIILAERNLGTLWRTEAYTENASWKIGPAELGYGDGDEGTVIADNPDPAFDSGASDKFPTAYFRRMLEVTDFHNITSVELSVLYDDAAALYLNGGAGLRTSNLPDAATLPELGWDYLATQGSTENATQTFNLPASALRSGSNLIAAEVHQNATTSSDLSFDLRIRVNRAIAAGLLANDSDPDPGEAAALTAELLTSPTHGTLSLNANGTFTYTPATNYIGPDAFTYRAKDPTGRTSPAVTVSLAVIDGPNVPPIAAPDTYAAVEDTVLNVTAAAGLLANDSDPESDPFTAVIATQPAHGTVTLNADGSFSYQPVANYNGQDSFTYQARDARSSAPALVTLNIASVNDLPVAVNNAYAGDPGTPFTVSAAEGVLANDTDADTGTTLTAAVVTPPAGAALTLNPDGSFTLTAATGGVFTFTYRASDGIAQSNTATVTVSLNAAPVAVADAYSTNEDQALNPPAASGVLSNESDPEGQPITAQLVTGPQNGTLTLNADGSFLYVPLTNFHGTDSFSYRVSDGVRLSNAVTVTLTVNPVNDAPSTVVDLYGVRVDTALQVNAANGVLHNDSDAENDSMTVALFAPPSSGNLIFNPDGSFTYTPAAGFTGSVTFSYRASDGTAVSAPTTVTLNVSAFLNTLVISEIMYNPPGAAGTLQEFLEVYNYGDASIDLTGWSFTKGVNYVFPAGTLIAGRGYLAIPADRAAFLAAWPGTVNVTSTGWGAASSLGNGGELVRLVNGLGETVDEVEYADEGDWAQRRVVAVWDATNTPGDAPPALDTDPGLEWVTTADPDPELGNLGGGSIQLRNPAINNNSGQNWADAAPTPGAANTAVEVVNSAPLISGVIHSPAVPNATQQVFVSAKIEDELTTGVTVSLFHRTWLASGTTPATAFTEVVMADNGLRRDGAAGDGVFGGVIPAQAEGTVVEFYVRASDSGSRARTWPAQTLGADGTTLSQNANCLYQVNGAAWTDHRPLYYMIMTGADNASWNAGLGSRTSNVAPNTTVIFRTADRFEVRYRAGVRARGNSSRSDTPMNLRMDLPKDAPWNGRTGFNLNYKYSYSQFLGSRLFEAAGIPCEKATLVATRINGANRLLDANGNRTFGYACDLVPRGGDTIKEWFPGNDDGNGYGKIRGPSPLGVSTAPVIGPGGYAIGGYINEGWDKQTNAAVNDWTDLHNWLVSMNAGDASNFDTTIAGTVDVDEWCRFLAVSAIVNHAETNLANGDDDDYSLYFGATDKLARIIPHDLDTCFNLNAIGLGDSVAPPTATIYQATEPNYPGGNATLPQMDKFYRNPVIGRKYKAALRSYLNSLFAKARFDATVDQLLDPAWMGTQFTPSGDTIRAHIKSFMDTRRATIATFLPTEFTATTSLALQNGFPRSVSATDLGGLGGKIDPARTASVTVNGIPVSTNPYGSTGATDNTWSAGSAITLRPGLNTLLCEARDESGAVFESRSLTIWFDAPGVNRGGSLAASETWSPATGPYNVTSSLTVPSGVVLTIQPGTTVYMASGANLTVSAGGRLNAIGTAGAGITFGRLPSGTGNWGGLVINGGTAVMSYVTFANNGSTALHSQNGAVVTLDHLTFLNPAEQFLSLDASSFTVSDCEFPTSTASFEPVHGSGGIAPGGQGIIRRCRFGKTIGYNDSIDFTGGNRPGPILQVYNCIFTGSDDDMLDLDSTDAWIEGNVFLHCHRNGASPDSSSAVSGGADNAAYSQVTVINNLFYDCDNAVTMKQGNGRPNGNSAVLLNNTIVRTTRAGGIDTGSGVVNFDDDAVEGEGKGMYLEGNVIYDAESLTRNYDPALSQLTMVNNILPVAPPATATASGNLVVDPMLNTALITSPATATPEQVIAALKPQLCSPAIARGPLGRNLGADLTLSGITVQSIPATVWPSTLSLNLGPAGSFTPTSQPAWTYGFTHYRYRLDGGVLSAELPVATPLTLTNLAAGPHVLAVEGKNDAAAWQEIPTVVNFTALPGAPTVSLSEVLADSATQPDFVELRNWGTAPADLSGCTISDDPALPGKFVFPAGTPPLAPGAYMVLNALQLGFNLSQGGETLRLGAAGGGLLDSVTFGPQLTDFSVARNGRDWRLGMPSPGTATTAVCTLGSGQTLRINEWLGSNSIIVTGDFVELYNPDVLPVDLSGYSLSQDFRNEPGQSTFPPLSFIAGSGFLELTADGDAAAGADHLNFKISRIRDSLALLDPAGNVIDNAVILPGNPDVSQGRTPDGSPITTYLALPTPGFSNGSDLTADTAVMNGLRITEIMFDPPAGGVEFIEFKNIGTTPITLTNVTITNGVTFSFPALTIPAGGYAVITQNLSVFNALYPGVDAVQWTSGRLDNGGETIRIQTGAYALGILDFRYDGAWYPETRSGASLDLVDPTAPRTSWSDKASWQPGAPSPGGPAPFGVLAPADAAVTLPQPAILAAWVAPGAFAPGDITVAWTKVSGPGTVAFTAPANKTTDANFSVPGVYELAITATPPGGGTPVTDTVVLTVYDTYASWAARLLTSTNAEGRLPDADPDGDGQSNLVEYAMGTSPTLGTSGPEFVIVNGHAALRYPVSLTLDPRVQVIPQISTDLLTWREGGLYLNHSQPGATASATIHLAEDVQLMTGGPRKYLRLKVVQP